MLIKFVEIDFKQPLRPIYVDERYGRLFVLVRWGYYLLTLLRFHCQPEQRTITVEQLRHEILQACGWQIWELHVAGLLEQFNQMDEQSLPPISVIVCTRDRPHSLQSCLRVLHQLDYPAYEVIVVDNCSQDPEVATVVAASGFRYVREDRPGLDWARNCGIQSANHEIVAFIDDDAQATCGWLRGIAQGFSDPMVMAVTGMVLPAEIETAAQNHFEIYGGMNKGLGNFTIRRDELDERALLWASNWGVGANMAFRRTLFQQIGNFNPALDVGTVTNGGGDIEFFYRTVAAGYALHYEPAAFVYHTHRRSASALNQQIYNNGRGFGSYLLTIAHNEPTKRARILWFALRWWGWEWLLRRYLRSSFNGDHITRNFALTELRGAISAFSAFQASQAQLRQVNSH